MTDNSIPVMNQPSNMMENGLNSNSLQTSALQKHPIDELQRRQGKLFCCLEAEAIERNE